MGCITQKCPESLSYQKKDGRVWAESISPWKEQLAPPSARMRQNYNFPWKFPPEFTHRTSRENQTDWTWSVDDIWWWISLEIFSSASLWQRVVPAARFNNWQKLRPAFFWYDTDFSNKQKKKFNIFFGKKNLKSRCHTKRRAGAAPRARPSFGMTTTQDIRDLFA